MLREARGDFKVSVVGGRGWGRNGEGIWGYRMRNHMHRIDRNQALYCVAQGTILNIL